MHRRLKREVLTKTSLLKHNFFCSGSIQALESNSRVVTKGPTGLLEILVTSLAERERVEPEGTLACEVGLETNKSYFESSSL